MSKELKKTWEGKTLSIPNSWLIIIVAVIFFTSLGAGIRQRYGLPGTNIDEDIGLDLTGEEGVQPGEGPSGEQYVRNQITIDFEIDQSDWQAGGAATPTTPVYSYFYEMPEQDESGTGITVGGEDIMIKASNDGIIWIDAYAGTDFYLVEEALRSANPNIVDSVVINDYDDDDQFDMLIKLDMSDFLREDFQYKPTYVLELPLLDVDVAGLDDDNPADHAGMGTSANTTTIVWKYTGLTANDGFVLSDLVVKTNDTEKGNDVLLRTMTISGTVTVCDSTGRVLSGSSLSLSPEVGYIGGSYAAYYTHSANDDEPLDTEALLIYRDTNAGDGLYFTLSFTSYFEGTEAVLIDIQYTLTSPDGTTAEETDQVQIAG